MESRIRCFEGRLPQNNPAHLVGTKVTNREVWKRADINDIVQEVKKRRWKWLCHVLRMKKDRHPYAALTWAPPGKRGRGRPLGTWRRTIEAEMEEAGKNWSEIRWLVHDRPEWRSFVDALRSIGAKRIG